METDRQELEQLRKQLKEVQDERNILKTRVAALESIIRIHGHDLPKEPEAH